jgi:hypothetical protein
MQTITQMITQGYEFGAPSQEAEQEAASFGCVPGMPCFWEVKVLCGPR